jgi:glycosyltransferase involved in cell wall biosynthesis
MKSENKASSQPYKSVLFSVVVPSLGRELELIRLLDSLARQTLGRIEVIIVDQNDSERLFALIGGLERRFPLVHIHTPGQRGASRARNVGWRRARGKYVAFADDDCWYPPTLFERVEASFRKTRADIVAGRATDETGRTINGRFETIGQAIDKHNVWTTSIEWMLFFRRDVLEALDGFDNAIGVGACTPWQSAEGQDIVLRALDGGFKCHFDPLLCGHHPELNIVNPDPAMLQKARAYGRGMGFVLRRHGYGPASMIAWIGRPSVAALLYALRGELSRARYYRNVMLGRLEGWRQRA